MDLSLSVGPNTRTADRSERSAAGSMETRLSRVHL